MTGGTGPGEKFNRDIDPSDKLAHAYPELGALIVNRAVSEAFAARERAAVKWKRRHSRLGKAALLAILLVMLVLDYRLTLAKHYGGEDPLAIIGACAAAVGLAAQLFSIFSRSKEKWLVERFGAERLRCMKFQAFALAATTSDPARLKSEVETFTNLAIAKLDQDLMAGKPVLRTFDPADVFIPAETAAADLDPAFVRKATDVYDRLRLQVQLQHFEGQAERSRERARRAMSLAELAFIIGALCAVAEVLLTASHLWPSPHWHVPGSWQDWLNFLTWAMFATSAVIAVYERGAGEEASTERYTQYAAEIRRIKSRLRHDDAGAFLDMVREMERIGLRELHDFCRDAERSSYIF
jgi:hypothetical protein